ncbi:MAG: hypothetical protein ACOCOR_05360, partial [Prevotella sp.]
LNVNAHDDLPPAPDVEARQAVEGKRCRYCVINIEHTEAEERIQHDMDIHDFRHAEPVDIIKLCTKETEQPFTDDMEKLFAQVVDEVRAEEKKRNRL